MSESWLALFYHFHILNVIFGRPFLLISALSEVVCPKYPNYQGKEEWDSIVMRTYPIAFFFCFVFFFVNWRILFFLIAGISLISMHFRIWALSYCYTHLPSIWLGMLILTVFTIGANEAIVTHTCISTCFCNTLTSILTWIGGAKIWNQATN